MAMSMELPEDHVDTETPAFFELNADQHQTLHKTFMVLQKKGTKKKSEVDERDVPMLIRALGVNPSDKQIEQIILKTRSRQPPKTTQGYVDYHSFEQALAETLKLQEEEFARHTEEQIIAAFRALTPDNKEFLEPHNLKKLLMEKGVGFSDEEADKMIRTFKDKDTGMLWHDDIAEILAKDGLPTSLQASL